MELFPDNAEITTFVVVNWGIALATSLVLLGFYRWKRHLFVKPSMMLVALHHILVQWPLAVIANFTEDFVPQPWSAALLVHGFVIIGLALSLSFNASAH